MAELVQIRGYVINLDYLMYVDFNHNAIEVKLVMKDGLWIRFKKTDFHGYPTHVEDEIKETLGWKL